MRKSYLVTYDISNAKRLRKVFKTMLGFGDHAQYSVFVCELSKKEKALLLTKLERIIHHKDDRVMIVDLGPADGRGGECIETLGKKFEPSPREAIVV